jgi:hypothetical protein
MLNGCLMASGVPAKKAGVEFIPAEGDKGVGVRLRVED